MTDWPETPVPCAANPRRWQVPYVMFAVEIEALAEHLTEAVNECRSCPALLPCGEWAAQFPPVRQVQAARIYEGGGEGLHVYQWRARARNRVTARTQNFKPKKAM